jgi:hypothetical protein
MAHNQVVLGSSPSGPTLQSKVYDDKNIINLFSCKKSAKTWRKRKEELGKRIS